MIKQIGGGAGIISTSNPLILSELQLYYIKSIHIVNQDNIIITNITIS